MKASPLAGPRSTATPVSALPSELDDSAEAGRAPACEVGYGRPPIASRWRKGQSGNPGGRRKGQKNVKTEVREEAKQLIVATEGGTRKKISKSRALVKAMFASAMKGNVPAAAFITGFLMEDAIAEQVPESLKELSEAEICVVKRFLAQRPRSTPRRKRKQRA